ncbi:helix-turn-helix domain-containing protein [Streptomyces angustmyceticus]
MTKQLPAQEAVPRARALAPLSADLGTEVRAFAEHLRSLRESAAKTSADLAGELDVDPTRLSRYLSGQSLPEPQLLTRLHQLLADQNAEPPPEKAARASRALLYAAARSKGQLAARAYEIGELQEKLHEQQTESARSLTALQDNLQDERDRRHRAEQEIEQLRHATTADKDEQIRQLEAERDHALHRVAELEDLVAQTGALLRLQQDDARHVDEMAQATAGELQHWEDRDSSTVPEPDQDVILRLDDGSAVTCDEVVEKLAELRDAEQDSEADQTLREIAEEVAPPAFGRLFHALKEQGRKLDADRLLRSAAIHCDGLRLRQLLFGTGVLCETPPIPKPFGDAPPESITYEDTTCSRQLAIDIGYRTPVPEFIRLHRALTERSEHQLLWKVTHYASKRPSRSEKRQLRDAGITIHGPVYRLLHAAPP